MSKYIKKDDRLYLNSPRDMLSLLWCSFLKKCIDAPGKSQNEEKLTMTPLSPLGLTLKANSYLSIDWSNFRIFHQMCISHQFHHFQIYGIQITGKSFLLKTITCKFLFSIWMKRGKKLFSKKTFFSSIS